jgi:hypothetical protein
MGVGEDSARRLGGLMVWATELDSLDIPYIHLLDIGEPCRAGISGQ